MARHKGPVAWSNDTEPPGHFAVDDDGQPDFSARVKWVEAEPDDPDDLAGHWETHAITDAELSAAREQLEARLVNLRAVTKGKGSANGG